jgi:hypothetical protein
MVFIPHQILRSQSNHEANDWLRVLHRLREKTACSFVAGKTEVTRLFGTPWRKYKDNIKMYVREIGLN